MENLLGTELLLLLTSLIKAFQPDIINSSILYMKVNTSGKVYSGNYFSLTFSSSNKFLENNPNRQIILATIPL